MNDTLLLIAEHERASRARLSAAARDLRAALAPSRLVRRGIRAQPWAAVAIAGAGGMMIGGWLGSRPGPAMTAAAPAPVSSAGAGSAPARPPRDWGRMLVQASQVIGALAAAKAAHTQSAAPAPSEVCPASSA